MAIFIETHCGSFGRELDAHICHYNTFKEVDRFSLLFFPSWVALIALPLYLICIYLVLLVPPCVAVDLVVGFLKVHYVNGMIHPPYLPLKPILLVLLSNINCVVKKKKKRVR